MTKRLNSVPIFIIAAIVLIAVTCVAQNWEKGKDDITNMAKTDTLEKAILSSDSKLISDTGMYLKGEDSETLSETLDRMYSENVPTLTYIINSTYKICQLIGDTDYQFSPQKTINLTESRYGLKGTDTGPSFEHEGHVFFVFGDCLYPGGDCMAYSTITDPEGKFGMRMDFFTSSAWLNTLNTANKITTYTKTNYLKVEPDGKPKGGFEIPVGGITVKDKSYIFFKMDYAGKSVKARTDKTYLVRFLPGTPGIGKKRFKQKGLISSLAGSSNGRFIDIASHLTMGNLEGLPFDKQQVLLWGTGVPRESHVYLATVTVNEFDNLASSGKDFLGSKTIQYFAGYTDIGQIKWSQNEAEAAPLFYDYYNKKKKNKYFWNDGTIQNLIDSRKKINNPSKTNIVQLNPMMGDVSVTWNKFQKVWIMTYDSRSDKNGYGERGVMFRYAKYPWGPWSEPQKIFDKKDGHNKFIHKSGSNKLLGPMIGNHTDAEVKANNGGAYAPYVIERFTKVSGNILTIYYTVSTWNPYTVVLMKSSFKISS